MDPWPRRGVGQSRLCERVDELRQPEVDDLDVAILGDEHVLRLEIAMNDAVLVFRQRVTGLDGQIERPPQFERTVLQQVAQRLPTHVLHDDVGASVSLADVVDGGDVRMIDGGREAGFLNEALASIVVLGQGRRNELERGLSMQLLVFNEEDFAHPALAEALDDAVVANRRLGHERGPSYPD